MMRTDAPAVSYAPPLPSMTPAQPPPPVPIGRAERSLAPDIARGAMLLFIAVANVGLYQWARPLDEYGHLADATAWDQVAHFLEQLLMADRSRPMFAILYGFGIAVMASRMTARGIDPQGARRVLRRRSLWLVALGVLHATLLFVGDILAGYGITGLIALGLVHLPDRSLRRLLWRTGAFVALVTTPLLAYALAVAAMDERMATGDHPAGASYLANMAFGVLASGASMVFAGLLLSYVPLVIAGLMLQRAGWLAAPGDHLRALRRVFRSAMVANIATALPVSLISLGIWHPEPPVVVVALYITLLGGMYAGLGYICGFALLAHRWSARGRRGLLGALAALGERSLTGYLGQSILLAPLLAPWALGLGEGLGYVGAYAYAVAAWLVTVVVAVMLDRRGVRGPFETLLRRLTYGTAPMVAGRQRRRQR